MAGRKFLIRYPRHSALKRDISSLQLFICVLYFSRMRKKILENVDPVCGMEVDPKRAKHAAERNGDTFSFCSESCRLKFEAEPERYVEAGSGNGDE